MRFISDHLPKALAWSTKEKKQRPDEYTSNEADGSDKDGKDDKPLPNEFSATTRFLARIIVTFFAASWLIVPIVIMTVPPTANDRAWDIITLTIAIVLFSAFAAAVVEPQSTTKDVITATAAYAAVLVVFYGNTIDRDTV